MDYVNSVLVLLCIIYVAGHVFEFINGFHDTANAIATVVATRVLTPKKAVSMASVMNFVGAVSSTAVAATIGKGLVDSKAVSQETIIAALLAAIIWDLFTWRLGLPTSSSHALLFGVLGAAIATAGMHVVISAGLVKVVAGLVYSPILGLLGGLALLRLLRVFFDSNHKLANTVFGKAQLVSSVWMAFSHGGNDGQKTMGIIALSLYSSGVLGSHFYIPIWVIITAATAIALGTFCGGWRIIHTMAYKLTELSPMQGFAAETAAGTVIEVATRVFSMPISTTHAISSAVIGVGAAHGIRKVYWKTAGNIVMAWVATLPACFFLGYLLMFGYKLVTNR